MTICFVLGCEKQECLNDSYVCEDHLIYYQHVFGVRHFADLFSHQGFLELRRAYRKLKRLEEGERGK